LSAGFHYAIRDIPSAREFDCRHIASGEVPYRGVSRQLPLTFTERYDGTQDADEVSGTRLGRRCCSGGGESCEYSSNQTVRVP
jgi:hypothetical protein